MSSGGNPRGSALHASQKSSRAVPWRGFLDLLEAFRSAALVPTGGGARLVRAATGVATSSPNRCSEQAQTMRAGREDQLIFWSENRLPRSEHELLWE